MSFQGMKAIETRYKDYRFRSRLEARWAVFFDSLGIKWEYEKEGYDLDGMWYLPDFWLPRQKLWVEVKPEIPPYPSSELEKCNRLAAATGFDVALVTGDLCTLGFTDTDDIVGSYCGWHEKEDGPGIEWDDGCWEFGECPLCSAVSAYHCGQHKACDCSCRGRFAPPDRPGNTPRCVCCDAFAWKDLLHSKSHRPWMSTHKSARIQAAYRAARSARFEHGETPK